jgi:hypothetical protein
MNQTCTIEGCEAHATVKGLCSKHYMRVRRHGDPNVVKPAGAPRSEAKAILREMVGPSVPTRTFDRYSSSTLKLARLLGGIDVDTKAVGGIDVDTITKVTAEAIRPNGSLNVNKFAGFADNIARVVEKEFQRLRRLEVKKARKKKLRRP